MKSKNYLKLIVLAIVCCLSSSMFGQTIVSDSTSFANAMADLQSPTGSTLGTGGVIQLSAPLILRPWKTTYLLASTSTAPIEINTQGYSITVSGTNITADSTILKIGDNLNIHGTSTVLTNSLRGIIRIAGSQISSTTSVSGTTTVVAGAGWIFMSGGVVSINATGVVNAYALGVLNNFDLRLRGGTISAIGDNTRALSLTDNVTTTPISGATITATGSGAYAIQSLGANSLTIGDNMTITTSSSNSSDAALIGGGATSKIIIPSTVNNLTLTSSIKYKLDNVGSAVIDLRGLTLSATPVDGSSLTYPTNNVIFTASGNESLATCGIYYSYSVAPTTASPNIPSGGSVAASSATTVLKASFGKNGFIDTNVYTFNYTVSNLPANQTINITTFADLQAAYSTSQNASSGTTTQMKLLANIPITSAFTMKPDINHPVSIDANNFYLSLENVVELGGYLSISSTITTTGNPIIRTPKAFTSTISGGTYTVNGKGVIILAPQGQQVSDASTKIYLSNATFIANGTDNNTSIIKFTSKNGNLVSATNCVFTSSAKSICFNFLGPQNVSLTNCSLTMLGNDATSEAFLMPPTNTSFTSCNLTIDGLALTMSAGPIFTTGGTQGINTIIKDLTLNGNALATLTPPTGGTGVKKFYDFRAFTPTVSVPAGNYGTSQNIDLSLTNTGIAPVDAGAATFVYTTDGTDPVLTSSTASPVTVATPTTIKMAAKSADGLFLGKIYSFPYTFTATSIANVDGNNGISIYPTTVKSVVTINKLASQIQVLDLAGKLMIQRSNATSFDMSTVKTGVYLVKIQTTDAPSKTFKVVKL